MKQDIHSIKKSVWPRWSLLLYIIGIVFPFIFIEIASELNLHKIIPSVIAILLLLIGPIMSVITVSYTNCSGLMSLFWILAIPVFLIVLSICWWVGGTVIFGRPFLPID